MYTNFRPSSRPEARLQQFFGNWNLADLTLVTLALWEVFIGIARKKGFRGLINLGNWIKNKFLFGKTYGGLGT